MFVRTQACVCLFVFVWICTLGLFITKCSALLSCPCFDNAPSIHPSIHPSIYPFIHPSIYLLNLDLNCKCNILHKIQTLIIDSAFIINLTIEVIFFIEDRCTSIKKPKVTTSRSHYKLLAVVHSCDVSNPFFHSPLMIRRVILLLADVKGLLKTQMTIPHT